jgi:hypothetical protein
MLPPYHFHRSQHSSRYGTFALGIAQYRRPNSFRAPELNGGVHRTSGAPLGAAFQCHHETLLPIEATIHRPSR